MYTIYELNLEDLYDDFLQEFLTSPQYNFYTQHIDIYSRDSRWLETLKLEIDNNKIPIEEKRNNKKTF
jgi:hypothetical protein